MKTRRVLHVAVALLVAAAILSCSLVTQIFTGETEKSSEQSGAGDEGESGQTSTGGEGESQESTNGADESSEPIVGTWKQISFQGVGGRSNVYVGGPGVWFGDYFYVGTVNLGTGPSGLPVPLPPAGGSGGGSGGQVQPGGGSGGVSGVQPVQPQGPVTGSGIGQPPGGQQPAGLQTGAEIWRTLDGAHWEVVGEPGLGNPEYTAFQTILYRDRLYVFTGWKAALLMSKDGEAFETVDGDWSQGDMRSTIMQHYLISDALFVNGPVAKKGLRAWLSTDGERFESVGEDYFGDPTNQYTCGPSSAVALDGWYYLGIQNPTNGGELLRTKDGRTWEDSLAAGFNTPSHITLCTALVHDGYVYVQAPGNAKGGSGRGVDVFRSADGEDWEAVIEDGFGLGDKQGFSGAFLPYEDAIYFVLSNYAPLSGGSPSTGFTLWKSLEGKSWQQVGEPGFGDPNNSQGTLYAIRDTLYLVTHNPTGGNQIWRSTDGTNWEQFFTFPANQTDSGRYLAEIADGLEYFEYDMANGIQIWRYAP